MTNIVPVDNCTGCCACAFSCPQGAIRMAEDEEGFLYPRCDKLKCDECGICTGICPVGQLPGGPRGVSMMYAGWTNDVDVLRQSSSGGVFSEIVRPVLGQGGVVFGAAYDEKMTVRHVGVETWRELPKLRGSKYVQSDVADTFEQVQRFLVEGRKVLYSGTPCQIAGLYAFLGGPHEELWTVDLICHGVPSPKVFRKAIASLEKRYKSRVVAFNFRDKSFGWLYPTVRVSFENGRVRNEHNLDNHYNLGFLKNVFLRPSCHHCPFKKTAAVADITLGDFWQLTKYQPTLINRSGTSAVVVNTTRGSKLIDACAGHLNLIQCPSSYLVEESNLCKSVRPSGKRESFFKNLDLLSFDALAISHIQPRGFTLRHLAWFRRIARRWIQQLQ